MYLQKSSLISKFVLLLLLAIAAALLSSGITHAQKESDYSPLFFIIGTQKDVAHTYELIRKEVQTAERLRTYFEDFVAEFPTTPNAEQGDLYRVTEPAAYEKTLAQIHALIKQNGIKNVSVLTDDLGPLSYVPGKVLAIGTTDSLKGIAEKYHLELTRDLIPFHGKSLRTAHAKQALFTGAYLITRETRALKEIRYGTVSELVDKLNGEGHVQASSDALLRAMDSGGNAGARGGSYIASGGHMADVESTSQDQRTAVPAYVREAYTGKDVDIFFVDNIPDTFTDTTIMSDGSTVFTTDTIIMPDGSTVSIAWEIAQPSNIGSFECERSCTDNHGVYVAGLAKAMASEANINIIPLLNADGFSSVDDFIGALVRLSGLLNGQADENPTIVNLSLVAEGFGWLEEHTFEQLTFELGELENAGAFIIKATGYEDSSSRSLPDTFNDYAITVGASYGESRACYSETGDVYTPGGGPVSNESCTDGALQDLVNDCPLHTDNCIWS